MSLSVAPVLRADFTAESIARFWRCVTKGDECWLWGCYVKNGYGCLEVRQRPVYAHRFSYALKYGETPALCVLHQCDTPLCVRPDHFFLGSRADNNADMRAKGRGVPPPVLRGEGHPHATLSDEQVAEMRRLRALYVTQRALASMFGVSQSTVWRIVHGATRS